MTSEVGSSHHDTDMQDTIQACENTLAHAYRQSFDHVEQNAFDRFITRSFSEPGYTDISHRWRAALGIPKMAALAAILISSTERRPENWLPLARAFVPLLKYYLFEAASDDLSVGLFWRRPSAESEGRVATIGKFCNIAIRTLERIEHGQVESISTSELEKLTQGQGLTVIHQSDSPSTRTAIIQDYCTLSSDAREEIARSSLISSLRENIYSLGEIASADIPTQKAVLEGLTLRYRAARAFITRALSDASARTCLEIGGESGLVTPSIMFMIGVAARMGILPDGLAASGTVESALLTTASTAASKLIRIYNDLGTVLATSHTERRKFIRSLRLRANQPRALGTELYRAVIDIQNPTDRRLAKDIRQGENNIVLEHLHWDTAARLTFDEALVFFEDRVELLASLQRENHVAMSTACQELERLGDHGAWASRLVRAWEQFNAHIYSQPSDTFWGDYLASDGSTGVDRTAREHLSPLE